MNDVRKMMKDLINSLLFLMNRQNLHLHQIEIEEKRFRIAVKHFATTHRKLEHVCHIRDFQLLLAENARQIRIHHDKLEKFLELNEDLKDTTLYQQAEVVLKEAISSLN